MFPRRSEWMRQNVGTSEQVHAKRNSPTPPDVLADANPERIGSSSGKLLRAKPVLPNYGAADTLFGVFGYERVSVRNEKDGDGNDVAVGVYQKTAKESGRE